MQKKFGESRIPEGIWSVETIRHTRGSKKMVEKIKLQHEYARCDDAKIAGYH